MRQQNQNFKRGHGRNNGGGGSGQGTKAAILSTFEHNGNITKIRGQAQQILEKYLSLAREASSTHDPLLAEEYYQHAEHYQRIVNEHRQSHQAFLERRQQQQAQQRASTQAPEAADDAEAAIETMAPKSVAAPMVSEDGDYSIGSAPERPTVEELDLSTDALPSEKPAREDRRPMRRHGQKKSETPVDAN